MKQEGNIIELKKNEQFYSAYIDERYWLLEGGVQIFVVEWFGAEKTINRQAGRGVSLIQLTAHTENNIEIPSLCYTDPNTDRQWRFSIKATQPGTRLEIRQGASLILKKNFLREAGINSYEAEGGKAGHGFENSLIALYRGQQAKDAAAIHAGGKNAQNIKKEGLDVIASGMNEIDTPLIRNGSNLYKTVVYAANKCGISNVEEEEKIRAACGGKEITVLDIARISHFICREITLDMDWYRNDCGVIIAYLPEPKDDKSKARKPSRPVACYMKGSKYFYYDAASGEEKKLDKNIADTLDAKAFSIRRTLPNKSVTRKDLVTFIKKGIHARDVAHMAVLGIICTLIGVLLPKLNQLIYDDYIPMGDTSQLTQICFVILSCMIGNVFISIVRNLQEYRIPARTAYEMQDAVYHRIFELPERFFRDYDSAELANRISSVSGIVNSILTSIFSNGFALAISIIYWIQMIHYSKKLTIVCLVMLSIYSVLVYCLSRSAIRYVKQIEEYKGKASGTLYQLISAVDKIRMAGAEERAVLEYSTPVANEKRISLKTGRVASVLSILSDASSTIFSMVLYYMIIKSKIGITMGAFMAFTTAFGSVSNASIGFVQALTEYAQMKPMMKRVSPILETAPEDDLNKDLISELDGDITVDHVTFAYSKDQAPVLNDISLHVSPGEYVAIVGASGCGKSTLLKLLMGFETPLSGRVMYDGKDIASVNKHSLRKKLGVVLQNGKLIAGSIYENITITSDKPDVKRVWSVIDDVGLRDDVQQMPMGIHTVLSESGGTISGGQQQRILIARAIYNEPKVLFFDEATSALDNITQAKVCESLEKRRMTRIVIAHRLSTVRKCDRILVLDRGKVVEEGNYDQLMNIRGRFYEMAVRQIV